MAIKSILVQLIGLAPDEDSCSAAISAARLLSANLEFLHVRPDSVVVGAGAGHLAGGAMTPEVYQTLDEEIGRRADTAKDFFNRLTDAEAAQASGKKSEPLSMSFAEESGNVAGIVADHARFTDLTVLAMPSVDADAQLVETAEAVLFESGRPVLFIPEGTNSIITDNVVIGWDGSPHAARATVDALPLLHTAKNVSILTIATGNDDHQYPERLSELLERHGVSSTLETVTDSEEDADQILLNISKAGNTNLLVMGGYGKHPIREFIFGGATRTLLNNASIPIFMSH